MVSKVSLRMRVTWVVNSDAFLPADSWGELKHLPALLTSHLDDVAEFKKARLRQRWLILFSLGRWRRVTVSSCPKAPPIESVHRPIQDRRRLGSRGRCG